MTWWTWFHAWANTNSGAVSILGMWITAAALLAGWIWARSTNKLIAEGRDSTQTLLKEIHVATQTTLGQLGQVLDRMDQAAEARY
jgi:hypothetical protein